jgi:cytidylate kinase
MASAEAEVIAVPVITVDGPSGSGKGTVCLELAARLGYTLLDSGALYRIVAWAGLNRGLSLKDSGGLVQMIPTLDISFPYTGANYEICVDGKSVGDALRAEPVSVAASEIAAIAEVRAALLTLQRQMRRAPGLVADGRDMGTVVFPDAQLKIFLTATAEERAQRRYKQLIDKGLGVNLRALLDSIRERDERDQTREVSPLVPAPDAIIVDSTHLSIEAVVQQILEYAEQRGLLMR